MAALRVFLKAGALAPLQRHPVPHIFDIFSHTSAQVAENPLIVCTGVTLALPEGMHARVIASPEIERMGFAVAPQTLPRNYRGALNVVLLPRASRLHALHAHTCVARLVLENDWAAILEVVDSPEKVK